MVKKHKNALKDVCFKNNQLLVSLINSGTIWWRNGSKIKMKILDENFGLRIQNQFEYVTPINIKSHAISNVIKMLSKAAIKTPTIQKFRWKLAPH